MADHVPAHSQYTTKPHLAALKRTEGWETPPDPLGVAGVYGVMCLRRMWLGTQRCGVVGWYSCRTIGITRYARDSQLEEGTEGEGRKGGQEADRRFSRPQSPPPLLQSSRPTSQLHLRDREGDHRTLCAHASGSTSRTPNAANFDCVCLLGLRRPRI